MSTLEQFKATYITESFELLEEMEEKLLALDEHATSEDLNAIFRCAHSIKGGGGAFGLSALVGFTHVLEFLLDAMREGDVLPSEEITDILLKSVDIVRQMVAAAQEGKDMPEDFGADIMEKLKALSSSGGGQAASPAKPAAKPVKRENKSARYDISFIPKRSLFTSGNEPLLLIRELQKLGPAMVSVDTSKVPALAALDPEDCYLSWRIELATDKGVDAIKEAFEFVEDECALEIKELDKAMDGAGATPDQEDEYGGVFGAAMDAIAEGKKSESAHPAKQSAKQAPAASATDAAPKAASVSTIRVDIAKVDYLVNMVGELVITQAMLLQQSRNLPQDQFQGVVAGVEDLSRHMRELQEAVMAVRMQPVKSVFSRMPRIVRDLSRQLGKDVRIETAGENTEIDKTVIEQLSDPLTHMIRNSVDHGVEMPDDRAAKGKPRQGVIRLSADSSGGRIIIEVADDGKGIDRERVLRKAKEKGLVAPDASLSNEEIDHLVFHPGFSTAEQVTNISGRGVGMDVVKRNISELGGTVNVENNPGKGARFSVSLPLTLAILDGMIIRVGAEHYIIPINNIVESSRPSARDVQRVSGGNDVFNVRGEFVPMIYLHRIFGTPGAITEAGKFLVVLVESGRQKTGLVVDEIVGQQQVVIKSIEENADPVPGVSGATILGDGNVALILDVAQLQKIRTGNSAEMRMAA